MKSILSAEFSPQMFIVLFSLEYDLVATILPCALKTIVLLSQESKGKYWKVTLAH
jgi:general stress protein CsbA